jgi:hypothetical protein
MISWMADSMWSIRSDIWFTMSEEVAHEGQHALMRILSRASAMMLTSVAICPNDWVLHKC